VREHPPSCPCTVVVVDNASGDGTVEAVESSGLCDVLIANERNEGFARAVNRAIEAAPAEFILLLNPDARLIEGTADRLLDFLLCVEKAGAAAPLIYNKNNDPVMTADAFPTITANFIKAIRLNTMSRKWRRAFMTGEPTQIDCAQGSCILVRRAAVRDQFFNEQFFLYAEEKEQAMRMSDRGFSIWLVPTAHAIHVGGQSTAGNRLVARELHVSQFVLYRLRLPQVYRALISALWVLVLVSRLVEFAVREAMPGGTRRDAEVRREWCDALMWITRRGYRTLFDDDEFTRIAPWEY
jgi:GT2 family glycosyltransferase